MIICVLCLNFNNLIIDWLKFGEYCILIGYIELCWELLLFIKIDNIGVVIVVVKIW